MPAIKFPSPILYLASEPSFFALLDGNNKEQNLNDVTRIDFPLIEKGVINKDNLTHALKSLDQKELHLVVSDEIFYHHISDYSLTAKKNIEDEIKETVATVFADKKEPLHIVTVDLAKTSKMQTVQITAMTKANLTTLAEAAEEAGITIESILPASFVVKAFVSVDPSLFLLATPQSYLLTSHYIGVDFAKNISTENEKELISTVRELKKERPHIQHIYICSAPNSESTLGESLSDILPIQDVEIKEIESENDTPFFLKALTIGVKEVVENDFPLPQFSVKNAEPRMESHTNKTEKVDILEKAVVEPIAQILKEAKAEEKESEKETTEEAEANEEIVEKEEEKEVEKEEEIEKKEIKKSIEKKEEENTEKELAIEVPDLPTPAVITTPKLVVQPEVAVPAVIESRAVTESKREEPVIAEKKEVESKTESIAKVISAPTTVTSNTTKSVRPAKKMNVFKYVLLTFGVALLISLVGGGIVISQQAVADKKNPPLQTPISEVTPAPESEKPTPTPEPTLEPVDLKTLDVLVVNATSIAGKAGKTAAAVKKAGAKTVDAGNAKDTYDSKGTFIMFAKPELAGAQSALEEATELSLEELDMSEKENVGGKYDIVIILNE